MSAIMIEDVDAIERLTESVLAIQIERPAQENIERIEAYRSGYSHFHLGVVMKQNPYSQQDQNNNKALATEWRKGWLEARENEENPKSHASIWDSIQNVFDE